MAAYAGSLGEEFCATGDEVALRDRRLAGDSTGIGRSRRLLLHADPSIKGVLVVDVHVKAHVCVLRPTELGAFTKKFLTSRVHVSLEQQRVIVARDDIQLSRQGWNPEAVDHVVRYQVGLDDCASGDVQGVGGDDLVVGIVKFPPPLVSNYSHFYFVSTSQIAQSEHSIDGGTQYNKQEDGRRNRPGDFEDRKSVV